MHTVCDQQSQQDDEPELQQHDRQVVWQPHVLTPQALAVLWIASVSVQIIHIIQERHRAKHACRIPYHTSVLTGEMWVNELLSRQPRCFWTELGVYQSTFILLMKAVQKLGLQSLHHVSIEQQVTIFLYIFVTGITCIHTGEHFQHSTSMISK